MAAKQQTVNEDLQVTLHAREENYGALEAIIENLTEGVTIAAPDGRLVVMNAEALRQHGFADVEEARRQISRFREIFELRTLMGDIVHEECAPLVRALRGERFSGVELQMRRLDTQSTWYVAYGGTPISNPDGTLRFAVVTSHDVTSQKRADAASLEREEQFRLMIQSAPNGIVMVDQDGRIALANTQAEHAFGYAPGELFGTSVEKLVPERFRGSHAGLRAGFMGSPAARPMGAGRDLYGLRKDRREFPVEIGLAPLQIKGKSMVLATIVDITERKHAEQTVRFLAEASLLLADSLDYETTLNRVANLAVPAHADWCGIDLADDGGNLQQVSVAHVDPSKVAWAQALRQKYPPQRDAPSGSPNVLRTGRPEIYTDISDELLRSVVTDEEHHRLITGVGMRSAIVAPLTARGRALGTITLVFAESGRRYRSSDLPPIEELARMCALAVDNARLYREAQHEIQERKRAEEEVDRLNRDLVRREQRLRELNETLEQRVADRTEALERTNRELQVRNRELHEFAYVASHDLQEPLRKIRSFAELLTAEHSASLDEEALMYLDRIENAARRMSTLIADLLSFSRVRTRSAPFQFVDLTAVVEEVIQDLEESIRESGGNVHVTDLPHVEADPLQMRQLFQNLLSNAIKYRRPDVVPEIRITGHLEHTEARNGAPGEPIAVLEVKDNGIGFEEKYAKRIFTPFQRLHATSAYPGTGMGLAICRRIVDRHRGVITARSTPHLGSTFIVHLPVRFSHEFGPAPGSSAVDRQV